MERDDKEEEEEEEKKGERKANAFIIVVGELGDLSRNKIFTFCRLLFPRTSFFSFLY